MGECTNYLNNTQCYPNGASCSEDNECLSDSCDACGECGGNNIYSWQGPGACYSDGTSCSAANECASDFCDACGECGTDNPVSCLADGITCNENNY